MKIKEAQDKIEKFDEERGWKRDWFIKDLSLNLVEEVGELWDMVKWVDEDNSSNVKLSDIYSVNVSVEANIKHDIFDWVVNNITYPSFLWIEYSSYLNGSLELGNLTIREEDNEIYLSINMSNSSKIERNSTGYYLTKQYEKINIDLNDIFDNNFTIGNIAHINFTIEYFYQNNIYKSYDNLTILVKNESEV